MTQLPIAAPIITVRCRCHKPSFYSFRIWKELVPYRLSHSADPTLDNYYWLTRASKWWKFIQILNCLRETFNNLNLALEVNVIKLFQLEYIYSLSKGASAIILNSLSSLNVARLHQCDQMDILFFNILLFSAMRICPKAWNVVIADPKCYQTLNKRKKVCRRFLKF